VSNGSIGLDETLNRYLVEVGVREHPVLADLRRQTAELPNAGMQIAPEEGALLALLVRVLSARRILEIGTFTGYSSTAMALAQPDGGRITCCDVSREWTDIARRAWADAGVDDHIDLRLGPAVATLDELLGAGEAGSYDLAFIDADKASYDDYYERCLQLVRSGGLIAIDNVLWSGRVADPAADDADTNAIRNLNAKIAADERVEIAMVPIADGVILARIR
jgi:predicted O-methyltransferase YrrM